VPAENFRGANILTLSEQQYFVWDTASQSMEREDMLNIFGAHGLLCPPGYACAQMAVPAARRGDFNNSLRVYELDKKWKDPPKELNCLELCNNNK